MTPLGKKVILVAVVKVLTHCGKKEQALLPVGGGREAATAVGKIEIAMVMPLGLHAHAAVPQFDRQHLVQNWLQGFASRSLSVLMEGQELGYKRS